MDIKEQTRIANQLLKEAERYTGKRFPKITEEEQRAARNSVKEWSKAGLKFDASKASYTDIEIFR